MWGSLERFGSTVFNEHFPTNIVHWLLENVSYTLPTRYFQAVSFLMTNNWWQLVDNNLLLAGWSQESVLNTLLTERTTFRAISLTQEYERLSLNFLRYPSTEKNHAKIEQIDLINCIYLPSCGMRFFFPGLRFSSWEPTSLWARSCPAWESEGFRR